MEPTTRHSLVLRLRDSDDQAAWSEFVEIYEPLLYRLARGRGLQDADARDVCQDVLRAVAGAIDDWDPDPAKGKFRAWLFRIARNHTVNFLVAQSARPQATGGTSVQRALEEAADAKVQHAAETQFGLEFRRRAFRWAAERVRHEFTSATWQAFWMTSVETKSPHQVGEELGMTVGAVYIARSRVMARIRHRVEQLTQDGDLLADFDGKQGHESNDGM